MTHQYKASSFLLDSDELVEIRAQQRTFGGAYHRTALGNLGYALLTLKLFDRRFYHIGIIYAILGGLFSIIALFRSLHAQHAFVDPTVQPHSNKVLSALPTIGQERKRIFGPPFVTAGWIVVLVAVVVAVVEIALLVFLLQI